MREIKFRAWEKETKKMVYDLFVGKENAYQNCELMQFTGLLDRNGKGIYEGDLIECYTKSGEKVYTYPHEVKLPDFYREIWSHDLESGLPAELGEKTVVLVVGNKFENPELLNN